MQNSTAQVSFYQRSYQALLQAKIVITEDFQTQGLIPSNTSSPWTGFAILFLQI